MFNPLASPINKIALGVASLAIVFGALWAYGGYRESEGARKERESALSAAAAQYETRVARVMSVGEQLSAAVSAASALEPKVLEKYRYVKQQNPLPVDCRVDPERMRSLADAVQAANAFGRRSAPVPSGVGAGK